ncbi:MAG: response regulator transcription factor [Treponema sp.]|nr:response regulator transcription factor [Treponema sp.]MCR4630337.1 response regulator transcription factor [Treponema sp.]
MTYDVFIIDDHPLFSRGLAQLIETQADFKVVGMAKDSTEALDFLKNTKPSLIILDLNLGQEDGLELIKKILDIKNTFKILVLSMHDERFYSERSIAAGARGYIMKEEAESQVINAINTVIAGNIYLSENERERISSKSKDKDTNDIASLISPLSDRQLQILTLIGKGLGTSDIAQMLDLSIKTIDSHKENMKTKLHCANTAELRQLAIEWFNKTH